MTVNYVTNIVCGPPGSPDQVALELLPKTILKKNNIKKCVNATLDHKCMVLGKSCGLCVTKPNCSHK